jgi:hypothetical protein
MIRIRLSSVSLLLVFWLTTTLVVAQNPKPPTPLPPEIQSVDQLPLWGSVVVWIDGQDLTAYIDAPFDPVDVLTTLEIKWAEGAGGFVTENCEDLTGEFDVCSPTKLAKVRSRGFGPVVSFGDVIPDGYLTTWSPAAWIVDGSYPTSCLLDCYDPNSPYFGPVPEPSSLTLLCLSVLLLRRRL